MRFLKTTLLLIAFSLFSSAVFANDLFFKFNADLKRVGLEEIAKMGEVKFESGNYRLDPDFKLGYGDTVQVNLWGKIEAVYKLTIDRDGNIVIPGVGKVNIMGLSLGEANTIVKKEIDSKYANVELNFTLVDVQDIRIIVLGNAKNPGPYAVSPFCTMIEALAKCGGPNNNGSLSEIALIRDGQQAVIFNACDFIFRGEQSKNIRLKHGDTIYIPLIKNLVAIRGDIRYPGIYDVGKTVKLSELIESAGGMVPTDFRRKIYTLRIDSQSNTQKIFKELVLKTETGFETKDDIPLKQNDTIIITTAFDFTPYPEDLIKQVSVSGEVKTHGDYLIKEGETLNSLLKRCGGLKTTAFAQGAVFTRNALMQKQKSILDELVRAQERAILEAEARLAEAFLTQPEKEARQRSIEARRRGLNLMAGRTPSGRIIINLEDIISGKSDITLEKGDSLDVPTVPDWVLVSGAVYNPVSVIFKPGEPLEYYLNSVGGPAKFADRESIYVLKANGKAESIGAGYNKIERGDIIIVPERESPKEDKLKK